MNSFEASQYIISRGEVQLVADAPCLLTYVFILNNTALVNSALNGRNLSCRRPGRGRWHIPTSCSGLFTLLANILLGCWIRWPRYFIQLYLSNFISSLTLNGHLYPVRSAARLFVSTVKFRAASYPCKVNFKWFDSNLFSCGGFIPTVQTKPVLSQRRLGKYKWINIFISADVQHSLFCKWVAESLPSTELVVYIASDLSWSICTFALTSRLTNLAPALIFMCKCSLRHLY